ncbi:hypothetical protein BVX95_01305 [archaeon D22]|nr:hypothetical protein BVX95_01305 [archaeon D22]
MDLPKEPTFEQKGLKGYAFSLKNKDLEVYYLDVSKGHDNYIVSKKCFHMYYVLEGTGVFDLNGKTIDVRRGSFLEVVPNIEYTYSGNMKLLMIMNPPWFEGNEKVTKPNPSVD